MIQKIKQFLFEGYVKLFWAATPLFRAVIDPTSAKVYLEFTNTLSRARFDYIFDSRAECANYLLAAPADRFTIELDIISEYYKTSKK